MGVTGCELGLADAAQPGQYLGEHCDLPGANHRVQVVPDRAGLEAVSQRRHHTHPVRPSDRCAPADVDRAVEDTSRTVAGADGDRLRVGRKAGSG
ncbi:hypothetical protein Adi01nite_74250 [Amorphoplanes digitatis]|nr:hypothetical protein Adi01nite_74250 [Actinoplanes digitatis]